MKRVRNAHLGRIAALPSPPFLRRGQSNRWKDDDTNEHLLWPVADRLEFPYALANTQTPNATTT